MVEYVNTIQTIYFSVFVLMIVGIVFLILGATLMVSDTDWKCVPVLTLAIIMLGTIQPFTQMSLESSSLNFIEEYSAEKYYLELSFDSYTNSFSDAIYYNERASELNRYLEEIQYEKEHNLFKKYIDDDVLKLEPVKMIDDESFK